MSQVKINGAISEEKMRELNEKLQSKESQKARRLLTLAGKMSNYQALQFVRETIIHQMTKNGHK